MKNLWIAKSRIKNESFEIEHGSYTDGSNKEIACVYVKFKNFVFSYDKSDGSSLIWKGSVWSDDPFKKFITCCYWDQADKIVSSLKDHQNAK